jgi:hypothetical protein
MGMDRVRRSFVTGVAAVTTSVLSVLALSVAAPMAGAATSASVGEELQVCALGVLGLSAPCETVPLPQSAAGMQSALSSAITALCPKLPSYGSFGSPVTAGCSFNSPQDEETYVINVWDGDLLLLDVAVSASPCGVQQVAVGPEEQQFSSLFIDLVSLQTTDCQLS